MLSCSPLSSSPPWPRLAWTAPRVSRCSGLPSGTVTSSFGSRGGRHDGIDIGMLRTLRLRAATGGVVRRTGYVSGYEGYGLIVVLDLPGPYTALYAHLGSVSVRKGQQVRKGQRLGNAGCTGSCSGTHLHFEIKRSGIPVNPLRFLG